MTRRPTRSAGRTGRLARCFIRPLWLAALIGLSAACGLAPAKTPVAADLPTFRIFTPLIASRPQLVARPKVSDVKLDGVLQNGPTNQILVLINHGNGAQNIGGWTVEIEGSGPIYRFIGGIIPPFEGKIWLTTSRESRISVFTLGYFPEDAGHRYRPGNVVRLKNAAGGLVDRLVVGDIPEIDAP